MRELFRDRRGSTAFIEATIALMVLIPICFMLLDVFAGLEQFHLARTLRNQHMSVIQVNGQLTTDQLMQLQADADDMGFTLKSFEIKRADNISVGTALSDAVVRDTLNFDNCKLTVTMALAPNKAPFSAGKLFGKTVDGVYVIPMKGVTWSELGKQKQ